MTAKMSQDAKKDEFRKYLEKAGVLELLTKSLVQLYEVNMLQHTVTKCKAVQEPEKPSDALSYLKNTVGGSADDKTVIENLKTENDQLKAKVNKFNCSSCYNNSPFPPLVKRVGGQPVSSSKPGCCSGKSRSGETS